FIAAVAATEITHEIQAPRSDGGHFAGRHAEPRRRPGGECDDQRRRPRSHHQYAEPGNPARLASPLAALGSSRRLRHLPGLRAVAVLFALLRQPLLRRLRVRRIWIWIPTLLRAALLRPGEQQPACALLPRPLPDL